MYFTGKSLIDYLIVAEGPSPSRRPELALTILTKAEESLFAKLESDYKDVPDDLEEQAATI
jgi:hypothetical protein